MISYSSVELATSHDMNKEWNLHLTGERFDSSVSHCVLGILLDRMRELDYDHILLLLFHTHTDLIDLRAWCLCCLYKTINELSIRYFGLIYHDRSVYLLFNSMSCCTTKIGAVSFCLFCCYCWLLLLLSMSIERTARMIGHRSKWQPRRSRFGGRGTD